MKPVLSSITDPFAPLRDTASAAARNLGMATDVQQMSPEHWQRVLAAVEARMKLRGVAMPDNWREELSDQMGRVAVGGSKPLKVIGPSDD